MESEAALTASEQTRRVLNAMRLMLIAVSLAAIAAICVTLWLYWSTIPQLREQRREVLEQQQEIDRTRAQLAESCVQLATVQNDTAHDPAEAVRTLDKCMAFFPQDQTLPGYKAEVMTSSFLRNPKDAIDLDYALQAAAQSLKIKPPTEAYDWQGIAYCLKAKSAQPADRQVLIDSAVHTFQAEFKDFAFRKDSLQHWSKFADSCPPEVQKALYP